MWREAPDSMRSVCKSGGSQPEMEKRVGKGREDGKLDCLKWELNAGEGTLTWRGGRQEQSKAATVGKTVAIPSPQKSERHAAGGGVLGLGLL